MDLYERVIELSRRRGFLHPSFEIYGGLGGFYDWGPRGARLLENVLDLWRQLYVVEEGLMEVSTPTIMPRRVFEASGHLEGFVDPMVDCEGCGRSFRADHLVDNHVDLVADSLSNEELQEVIDGEELGCPECGGPLSEVYDFNLMFGTTVGPGRGQEAYMRPETAQGIFVAYPRLYRYARERLPFGAVQVGRAYRNEVSPRQGVIRLREFTQAEVELFVDPEEKVHDGFDRVSHRKLNLLSSGKQLDGEAAERRSLREAVDEGDLQNTLFAYHLHVVDRFLTALGIPEGDLRYRQHLPDERAHYAADCWDAEVNLDRFGWVEVVGLADRTDYDLSRHSGHSGRDMSALRPLDEARESTVRRVEVDMSSLGPRLREDASPVVERLNERAAAGEVDGGDVSVEVEGSTRVVRGEEYEVVEEVERVRGETFTPHVIEPSYGVDRAVYAMLEKAFRSEEVEERERRVVSLPRALAPVPVAVLPLTDDAEMRHVSSEVARRLRGNGFVVEVDTSGNIGRRYRRQDEIGTPLVVTVDQVTVDPESEGHRTVTLRSRDSMEQVRVGLEEVEASVLRFVQDGADLAEIGE
ncbi:MAG: Threonine--tRNA ligase [Methanonatronarchaeales archaeon]|nr:Threonine--tRNA ligase [Methanonatronarchaeales archaeon]